MSVINKMLQDLDRRNAPSGAAVPEGIVRPAEPAPAARGREWFWRIVAVQAIVAAGWVGWVAWQLQPRPSVATDAGLQAGAAARKPAATVVAQAQPPAPAPALVAASEPPPPEPAVVNAPSPVVPPEPEVKVERVKEEPARPVVVQVKPAVAVAKAEAPPAARAAPRPQAGREPARLDLDVPQPKILQPPATRAARVEKRDLSRPPAERAEAEFRRSVGLMNQARVSEAEDGFVAALALHPAHEGARQALVSLLLERGRTEDARRLMQEGLAMNPANPTLAVGLAQLHASRRDYANALEVLKGASTTAAGRPDFHSLAGTILRRMGRNQEAVEAYSNALRLAPESGATWVGMGISLEGLDRRADAAESYRRGLATGTLTPEVLDYAEQRIRALR